MLDKFPMKDAYEVAVRNGYYLPARTCNWFTKKMLVAMVAGKVYCPMFE